MKPMFALFKTPNGYYFFDANKDEMISINNESFTYLSNLQAGKEIAMPSIPSELSLLKEQGYLKEENAVKQIRHVYTDYLDVFLERKLSKITLQLTQECNFRCKYCIYSEEHSSRQRNHSDKSMSWETAKKAIDFFRYHSVDSPDINIGFYGGEPLIEFPLLKKIVEYCKKYFVGKELSFTITTNGTLLTDEIIMYLKELDISLMISLDGPKEINDLNRVFIDGSGTFDTVAERVNRIKEIAPDYAEKLQISMVMDPENDFDCINEICIDGSEFNKLNISPSLVEREYGDESTQFSSEYIWKSEYQFFLAMLAYYERYPTEQVSPIANSRLSSVLNDYNKTCTGAYLRATDVPSGPCIPGQLRLFVNVEGKLFPCERVSEKSSAMCIGSIDEGFNLENASNILNVGTLTEEECRKCWCFRYCGMCAKKADNEFGQMSAKVKLSYCNESQMSTYKKMEEYLLLKEIPKYYSKQLSREEGLL